MNPTGIAATVLALLALFGVTEWLRLRGAPTDATRGAAHVLGAASGAAFPLYLSLADVLVIGALFTVILAMTLLRGSLRSIHAIERRSMGAVALPLGGMLTAIAVWPTPVAFSYAALVLALADPGAAAVGRYVGGPRWRALGGTKTVAGSTAFFAIALGLSAALAGAISPSVIAVAFLLTVVEGVLGYGLDDLAIPLAAGTLARILLV